MAKSFDLAAGVGLRLVIKIRSRVAARFGKIGHFVATQNQPKIHFIDAFIDFGG